jgi:hypothetical protein
MHSDRKTKNSLIELQRFSHRVFQRMKTVSQTLCLLPLFIASDASVAAAAAAGDADARVYNPPLTFALSVRISESGEFA